MVETSPKIPLESQILSVPIFPANALLLSLSRPHVSSSSPHKSNPNTLTSKPKLEHPSTCDCPHVLACDDDPFQTMYYKLLFENLNSPDKESNDKLDLKIELFPTGEGLLDRYSRIKTCGCGTVFLVITDYNMGRGKLNGVETIVILRKSGYKGPVILRSSEEEEFLHKQHPDFGFMMKSGIITYYIEKQNLKKAKEVMQNVIKANCF